MQRRGGGSELEPSRSCPLPGAAVSHPQARPGPLPATRGLGLQGRGWGERALAGPRPRVLPSGAPASPAWARGAIFRRRWEARPRDPCRLHSLGGAGTLETGWHPGEAGVRWSMGLILSLDWG